MASTSHRRARNIVTGFKGQHCEAKVANELPQPTSSSLCPRRPASPRRRWAAILAMASKKAADAIFPLNINVGIMGHVDSGKTSLVKALSTTLSTAALDKAPESKARGMTLDLGFSSFSEPPM